MTLSQTLVATSFALVAIAAHADNQKDNASNQGSFASNSQSKNAPNKGGNSSDNKDTKKPDFYAQVGDDDAITPGLVTSVPEPQTLLMLLVGVGLIGAIAHRRHKGNAA